MLHRRSFISGLVGLVAAPAIVRAESLMPVRMPAILRPSYDEIIEMLMRSNEMLLDMAWTQINPPVVGIKIRADAWRPALRVSSIDASDFFRV